jgi:hypothetical protein
VTSSERGVAAGLLNSTAQSAPRSGSPSTPMPADPAVTHSKVAGFRLSNSVRATKTLRLNDVVGLALVRLSN